LNCWAYLLHAKVKVWEDDQTYFCSIGQVHAKSTTSPLPAVKFEMKMSVGRSEKKGAVAILKRLLLILLQ